MVYIYFSVVAHRAVSIIEQGRRDLLCRFVYKHELWHRCINIDSPELYMNDVQFDNVQLVKHLGHIITSDLTDDKDIMHKT